MTLRDALTAGKFVVTGEVGPPKGTNLEELDHEVHCLKGLVQAVNVTDIQSSVMRMSALAVSARLLQQGVEPVYQMVCRDRNRLALQADLLGASALGIENILALTGDHVLLGDHPDAMPVFDLDSVSLLEAIRTLQAGKDLAGKELNGIPSFFPGAVVSPGTDPVDHQILKLERKVAAGARFIQTQAVFDPAMFETFMNRIRHLNVPVLVGIVVLKSAAMAKFMNANVAGISVPEPIIAEIASAKKDQRKAKAAEIAGRLVRQMKGLCQGVHIMPLGWTDLVGDILQQAGI